MSERDLRTASQRIEDLEKLVSQMYPVLAQVSNVVEKTLLPLNAEMSLMKDALKLINKRVEAVVQLAKPESGVTPEGVSNLVVKLNVQELTEQVATYVANNQLTPTNTVEDGSYLVCEELAADGTVVNPRIQFRLDTQDPSTVEAMKGHQAGDVISFGEGKLSAKLLEIYKVVAPSRSQSTTDTTQPQEETVASEPNTSEESPTVSDSETAANGTETVNTATA